MSDRINLLVHHVEGELRLAAGVVALGTDGQVSRSNQLLGALIVIRRRHEVAGDLLAQEQVVRLVLIEGADHIVAVPPRVRVEDIGFLTAGLAKARNVKPVPTPSLAEAW